MNVTAPEFVPSQSPSGNSPSGSNTNLARSSRAGRPQTPTNQGGNFSKHNNTSGQHAQKQGRQKRASQREKKAAGASDAPQVVVDDYEVRFIRLCDRLKLLRQIVGQFVNKRGDISLTHLLNFTFPPRQQSSAVTPTKRRGTSYQPFLKEKFINANYRFVMDPKGDYTANLFDSDIIVEWNDIQQVLVPTSKPQQCPICLSEPMAPRMTRCGHVYCFPCILHYLSLDESSKWVKCPLCHDAIYGKDLKSARFIHIDGGSKISPLEPKEMSLTLVKRGINSALALPRSAYATWKQYPFSISQSVPPPVSNTALAPFAKLMVSDSNYLRSEVLEPDRKELGQALNEALHEESMLRALGGDRSKASIETGLATAGSERPFIEMALAEVKKKLASLPPDLLAPVSSVVWFPREEPESILTDDAGEKGKNVESGKRKQSGDGVDGASRPKSRQSGPPSDGYYYFYQASDGQHIYLHPLEIRLLKHEYGEYDRFPDTLNVKVMTIQESTMTEDLKKKCKYLGHVPYSCDVNFCELDLNGLVSADTLAVFEREVKQREKRYKKLQDEILRERASPSPTGASMSVPEGFIPIQERTREQITNSWEDPTLFETLWPAARPSNLATSPSDEASSSISASPPARGFAQTPKAKEDNSHSFANIAAKKASGSGPVWPRKPQGAWGARAEAAEDFGEFEDGMGWALDLEEALVASSGSTGGAASVEIEQPVSQNRGSGKKGKGQKKILLVSNGGQRKF
ncbi:RING finger protein 10 [Phlyctochytrium bullatum]|nr:RING finger protein 10 [Phlyctochytrium bullatum]